MRGGLYGYAGASKAREATGTQKGSEKVHRLYSNGLRYSQWRERWAWWSSCWDRSEQRALHGRPRQKAILALAVVIIAVFAVCDVAYAANDGIVGEPQQAYTSGPNQQTATGYVINANNEYIAALFLINRYDRLIQIQSEMYAKLSNEETGGRFYTLVQEVGAGLYNRDTFTEQVSAMGYPENTFWVSQTLLDYARQYYGREIYYYADFENLIAGAREDFDTILGGGDLGGSGGESGPSVPDGMAVYALDTMYNGDVGAYLKTGDGTRYYTDGATSPQMPSKVYVVLRRSVFASVAAGYHAYIGVRNLGGTFRLMLFVVQDSSVETRTEQRGYLSALQMKGPANIAQQAIDSNNLQVTMQDGNFVITYENNVTLTNSWYRNTQSTSADVKGGAFGAAIETSIEPRIPETNWPEENETQHDPNGGNPPFPPIGDTQPNETQEPDPPEEPVIPHPNPRTYTTTDQQDYTEWLANIEELLRHIDGDLHRVILDMATHCRHLRDAMYSYAVQLGNVMEWQVLVIHSDLQDIYERQGILDTWLLYRWQDLSKLLKDIVTAIEGIDITSPSAGDPVSVDLSGINARLDVIIGLLAVDMIDLPDGDSQEEEKSLADKISEAITELCHKFPFSLPWDVYALLVMLRAQPVAPTFTLPVIGSDASMTIDMSVWSDVASVTRSGTLFLFALGLMLRTKSLLFGGGVDA